MRVTIWEEKRCFSSFEVPLDLTVLTHVSLENEDFVSQDISITFQPSYFPVKDSQFSKPPARVSQSFLIVLSLMCHRNISHSENSVQKSLGEIKSSECVSIQSIQRHQAHGTISRVRNNFPEAIEDVINPSLCLTFPHTIQRKLGIIYLLRHHRHT